MAVETMDCTELVLCPKFTKTFEVLGKKWNGLILEVLLNNGPSRFRDLTAAIPKCSDRVLVERLRDLEEAGIVDRLTFKGSSLIQYQLSEKGAGLAPVMKAAHAWGDEWISDAECE